MEKPKETRSVTIRGKIRINGITEEEVFDSLIQVFRDKWDKQFKLQVSGRDKNLIEDNFN